MIRRAAAFFDGPRRRDVIQGGLSMNSSEDTIAAIATPPGQAGIAVVRISGPDALNIGDKLFKARSGPVSACAGGSFLYGHLADPAGKDGGDLDEAIALIYRAPHSYTREDVLELQCHGGRQSAGRTLRAVLQCGARIADPGEFTRRAFLNGRIDLVQAEAVADLISARTERAARVAVEQLEGRLSSSLADVYDVLLSLAADVEGSLDLDDEMERELPADWAQRLEVVRGNLQALLSTWGEGHLVRDGALVVICGRPNTGKSSLMNALLGKPRAIVAPEPGTTRDTIEEEMILEGIPVRLVDTAGVRKTDSAIEGEGVRRALDLLAKADLVLHVVDTSVPADTSYTCLDEGLSKTRRIAVLNKSDLPQHIAAEAVVNVSTVTCCALKGDGVESLRKEMAMCLGVSENREPHAVISERHRQLVEKALVELGLAAGSFDGNQDLVLSAIHLKAAAEEIGKILGRSYTDDVLDSVFSRFCVGK